MNKKSAKKALLLVLCAILLVVASVMGTLAYLTSKDDVTNTFTVGNVNIKLDEAKTNTAGDPLDANNNVVELSAAVRHYDTDSGEALGNAYHLIPGSTYTKDPTVTVLQNSEECYVRMLVTVTFDALPTTLLNFEMDSMFAGYSSATWDRTEKVVDADTKTITYEYRYVKTNTVAKNTAADTVLDPLFTGMTIPAAWDNAEMNQLTGMSISIVAQAIQAENMNNADAAWTAYDLQFANP